MSNFWTVTLQQFEDLKDLNLATLLDAIMFGLLIFILFLFFFCCYMLYLEYKSEKEGECEAEESKKVKEKKGECFGMDEKLYKLYKEQRNLRDMIDGELNRIAVTDSEDEIKAMVFSLVHSISSYSDIHIRRLYENYNDKDKKENAK